MYCKNCGAKMTEDAKFCAKCGTSAQSGERVSAREMDIRDDDGAVLFKAEMFKKGLYWNLFLFILLLLYGIIMLLAGIFAEPLLRVLGIVAIIVSFTVCPSISLYSRSFICVCENKVYGLTRKGQFELKFSEIMSVRTAKSFMVNNVSIETKRGTFSIPLDQASGAVSEIQKQLDKKG